MRIARSTGVLTGLLLVVLGIWGGIIPFVGPYFGYSFGSHATWHYTDNRLWLDILPAAAVILGGLILVRAGDRVSAALGSWLAIAGGAWFAVGPAVSRVWEHGPGPIGAPLFGATRQMLELIGYFYGLGVLIATLAAFALGRALARPGLLAPPVAVDERPAAAVDEHPAAADPTIQASRTIPAGRTDEPIRRRTSV